MSFHAVLQAFNLPDTIKGATRLTAIAIANRANPHPDYDDQLCCWPAIKGLSRDIGASKSAVKNALNALEERNIITRIRRSDGGRDTSTLYIWHPWRSEGWNEDTMHRREAKERGYSSSESIQEPQEQPSEPIPAPTPALVEKPAEKPADGFTEWWPHYPKKVKKLDAEKAYRAALKLGVTPEELLQGLQRQKAAWKAKGTEPQYIPYPATWLRAGSWEDEFDTPALGQTELAINPATGKTVTKEDFWYACKDHGIDPAPYVNFWKPSMGLPGDPGWANAQTYLDRHTGRA